MAGNMGGLGMMNPQSIAASQITADEWRTVNKNSLTQAGFQSPKAWEASEIDRALGSDEVDWSFDGDTWFNNLGTLPVLEFDKNDKGKLVPTQKRRGLMGELTGGSLIDEPLRFLALPFLAYFLQERAEIYQKLDNVTGITNYADYAKRITTTSEDSLRSYILSMGLRGLGLGLGGNPYLQSLAGAKTKKEKGLEESMLQQYEPSETLDYSKKIEEAFEKLKKENEELDKMIDSLYKNLKTNQKYYQNSSSPLYRGYPVRRSTITKYN